MQAQTRESIGQWFGERKAQALQNLNHWETQAREGAYRAFEKERQDTLAAIAAREAECLKAIEVQFAGFRQSMESAFCINAEEAAQALENLIPG